MNKVDLYNGDQSPHSGDPRDGDEGDPSDHGVYIYNKDAQAKRTWSKEPTEGAATERHGLPHRIAAQPQPVCDMLLEDAEVEMEGRESGPEGGKLDEINACQMR